MARIDLDALGIGSGPALPKLKIDLDALGIGATEPLPADAVVGPPSPGWLPYEAPPAGFVHLAGLLRDVFGTAYVGLDVIVDAGREATNRSVKRAGSDCPNLVLLDGERKGPYATSGPDVFLVPTLLADVWKVALVRAGARAEVPLSTVGRGILESLRRAESIEHDGLDGRNLLTVVKSPHVGRRRRRRIPV